MFRSEFFRSYWIAAVWAVALAAAAPGCQSSPTPEEESSAVQPPSQQEAPDQETAGDEEFEEPDSAAPMPGPAGGEPDEEVLDELAEQVSDQDLEMFARGVRAVAAREEQLREQGRDLDTRLEEATSPTDRVVAKRETGDEMKDAVEGVGIEFEAFMNMGGIIRHHPGLLDRLGEVLDDDEIDAFFGVP